MTGLTATVLFAGAGLETEALRQLGIDVTEAINHDPITVQTHEANHPTTRAICADITLTKPGRRYLTDVLAASPSCFPAGTPVLTARGVVPIETVIPGDQVLTHKGRWRPVTATMSRVAPVWADRWLAATLDHRFYAREQTWAWDNSLRRYRWDLTSPAWTPASDVHKRFLALAASADPLPVPAIAGRPLSQTPEMWWVIGRWLGDGWLRVVDPDPAPPMTHIPLSRVPRDCLRCGKAAARHGRYLLWNAYCSRTCSSGASRRRRPVSRSEITICCGKHEADGLESKLAATGLRWTRRAAQTTDTFTTSHVGLARWLAMHFGKGAAGKTVPGWAFGMPENDRRALLDGYLSADGCLTGTGWRADTVSTCLASGIRTLATTLGYTTSLHRMKEARTGATIEGRAITELPRWTVTMKPDDGRYTQVDGLHRWAKARRPMSYRGDEPVFDLTVADDHSFVAHGFVVHNCTAFTRAQGKAKGADLYAEDLFGAKPDGKETRALMWDVVKFVEAAHAARRPYRLVFVENVAEIHDWVLWPAWQMAIHALGYDLTVVSRTAAFDTGQDRHRSYVLAVPRGCPLPDIDFHPVAPCPGCNVDVEAVQTWRSPDRQTGTWLEHYDYRCPICRRILAPYAPSAADMLDVDRPGRPIGSPSRLAPKSTERAARAFAAWGPRGARVHPRFTPRPGTRQVDALTVSYYSDPGEKGWPILAPVRTLTTADRHALLTWPSPDAPLGDCGYRMVSIPEQKRLMGLRDDYWLAGTQDDQKRQLGNGVVVPTVANVIRPAVAQILAGAAA